MIRRMTPEAEGVQDRVLSILGDRGWSVHRLSQTIGAPYDPLRGLTNGVSVPQRATLDRIIAGLDALEAGTATGIPLTPQDEHNRRALARFMAHRRHRTRRRITHTPIRKAA